MSFLYRLGLMILLGRAGLCGLKLFLIEVRVTSLFSTSVFLIVGIGGLECGRLLP